MTRVLFLGFDRTETGVIAALEEKGCTVDHTAAPVSDLSAYDLVVSYGYRHILRQPVIDTARRPILNLHISYLPWNRGAHPLFWAAYDGTPVGVTVHEIDAGVDTGRLCFQREVPVDFATNSFEQGYATLRREMEELFVENIDVLLDGTYQPIPQQGEGTMKRVKDLPEGFAWSDNIARTIARLKA
jgi:methionyl-tRNA formyltransferase